MCHQGQVQNKNLYECNDEFQHINSCVVSYPHTHTYTYFIHLHAIMHSFIQTNSICVVREFVMNHVSFYICISARLHLFIIFERTKKKIYVVAHAHKTIIQWILVHIYIYYTLEEHSRVLAVLHTQTSDFKKK